MVTLNAVTESITPQELSSIEKTIPPINRIIGTDNPDILFGTPGDDFISALDGNDTIIGTTGNDTIVGGNGFDAVDYSNFDEAVTILPAGAFDNGAKTQLVSIEKIIAPRDRENTIDASTATKGDTSIDVDLSNNSLVVIIGSIIFPPTDPFPVEVSQIEPIPVEPTPILPPTILPPPIFALKFEVENFVNVTGTSSNDRITGNSLANKLDGSSGSDQITGKGGNDTIIGGNGSDLITGTDAQARGVGEQDNITGGNDGDVFILGDKEGSFYRVEGNNDFAEIRDFSFGDRIELSAEELYTIERLKSGFNLFVDSADRKDLVAKVKYSFNITPVVKSRQSSDIIADSDPLDNQIELPSDSFQLNSGETLDIFTVA